MTSFFLSIVVLDGEHATKLKRNRHIQLILFLLSSSPIKIICIPEKLLSTMKVAFLFLSFFGKITYENEIAVSTKNTIAHTWLTRLAALFKTIPDSNQLPHCSNGINPYAKKRICAHQRIKQDVIPNFYFLLCIGHAC